MTDSEYQNHITVLGWVHVGFSLILVFLAVFALLFLSGIGIASQDTEAVRILSCVGMAGAVFLTGLAIPGLIAGYGLLHRRSWGRVIAIIVAGFNLFNIPVGTALGIYALWLLTDERAPAQFL